jgi:Uma2 family endonuclease
MAESDFQRVPLTYAIDALKLYFEDQSDVYVSGDLFIYFEEGNPQAVVAPDVFVVFGVANKPRRTYKVWEEKRRVPDFVLEITSRTTYFHDQGTKRGLYALLGVREYFQYDPTQDYLDPPLQGFRLESGSYGELPVSVLDDGTLSIYSQVLGLDVRVEGDELTFYDPRRGYKLPSYQEAVSDLKQERDTRQAAELLARQEAEARKAAEQRIAELEAQLAALRGGSKS